MYVKFWIVFLYLDMCNGNLWIIEVNVFVFIDLMM